MQKYTQKKGGHFNRINTKKTFCKYLSRSLKKVTEKLYE